MSEGKQHQRTVVGRVLSNRMEKTVTVLVERRVQHPLYGKYLRRGTKLHVHDESNRAREGDFVTIAECRPISRTKSWRVVAVHDKTQASAG